MFWLAVLVFAVAAAWIVLRIRGTMEKRKLEEEARAANFMEAQKKKLPKER